MLSKKPTKPRCLHCQIHELIAKSAGQSGVDALEVVHHLAHVIRDLHGAVPAGKDGAAFAGAVFAEIAAAMFDRDDEEEDDDEAEDDDAADTRVAH